MKIGFNQRWQVVSENAVSLMNQSTLSIAVSSLRVSERNHTIVFRYQESTNAAKVETFTVQNNPQYDALFGIRTDSDTPLGEPIVVTHVLTAGSSKIPALMTRVRDDVRPEDTECYTISILTPDIEGIRESFTCNEDEKNPTDFFCDHTICIIDDDGQFTYSVI